MAKPPPANTAVHDATAAAGGTKAVIRAVDAGLPSRLANRDRIRSEATVKADVR